MKLGKLTVPGARRVEPRHGGCSRNNIEAVNLANEGDQANGGRTSTRRSRSTTRRRSLDPDNDAHLVEARARVREEGRLAEDGAPLAREEAAEKAREEDPRRLLLPARLRARAARQKGRKLGRREGAAPDAHPARPELRPGLRRARRGSSSTPTTRGGARRTGPRRSRSSPTRPSTTSRSPTSTSRLMLIEQAEQVLKEGLSFAKRRRQAPLQPALAPRQLYENKGDISARGHRVRGRQEGVREQQVQRPQRGLLQPGIAYAELNPPGRTRPSSSSSRSGRSPARARRAKYGDQCASRRRSRVGSAALQ